MTRSTLPSSSQLIPSPPPHLFPCFFLIVAILLAYSDVFDNPFIYDDDTLIVHNDFLRHWNSVGSIFSSSTLGGSGLAGTFYRPIQILLYLFLFKGSMLLEEPLFCFHTLNVVLHIANACLVYYLGYRLRFAPLPSFLGALLWGLHPLHTEAITYISGTADPLYVFFGLCALVIMVPTFSKPRMLAACAFTVLALLSKESAVVIPLLTTTCLFLTERTQLTSRSTFPWARLLHVWPLWLVAAIYTLARKTWLNFNDMQFYNELGNYYGLYTHSMLIRIYTCLATFPNYLSILIYPHNLHFARHFPIHTSFTDVEVGLGAILVLLALSLILYGIKNPRMAPLSWGLLWFASAHATQTGIIIPVNSVFLEHWMYLPSLGLILGACQTLHLYAKASPIKHTDRVLFCALLACSPLLGVLTYNQNEVWSSPIYFFQNILNNGERSNHIYNNLGKAYLDDKEYNKALEQFTLATQVIDNAPEVHLNIAYAYTIKPGVHNYAIIIDELKKALQIDANFAPALDALSVIYNELGDHDKATYYKEKSLSAYKLNAHTP